MSVMGSFRRGMIGGRRDPSYSGFASQSRRLATYFNVDEYLKHRTPQQAFGDGWQEWMRTGAEPPKTNKSLNERMAARRIRLEAHDRRSAIATRYTTGKSARRRKARSGNQ